MIRTLSLAFFLLLSGASAQGQNYDDPVAYLEGFNRLHGEITNSNLQFLQYSVHSDDPKEVAEMRLELIIQILGGVEQLEQLEPYPGDAGMRSEMLEILATYLDVFRVDFEHVEKLLVDSRSSYPAMEKYIEARNQAEARLAAANDRFHTAAEAFASANQIRLIKGAPDSEIAQLNRLSKYKDQVFLSVFRVKKRNDDFRQAMEDESTEEMRSYRNAILEEANQELEKLGNLDSFNGDVDYRNAALAEIQGIREVAELHYPAFIAVKEKATEDLQQADIDSYNAAVDALNEVFPRLNAATNQARQQLLRNNVPKPTLRGTKRI